MESFEGGHKKAVLRPDCDFFIRQKEYEEQEQAKSLSDDLETKAFLNKLGIFFRILREGDSFNRFERDVAGAKEDGIFVGDKSNGVHFVNIAMKCLRELLEEKCYLPLYKNGTEVS